MPRNKATTTARPPTSKPLSSANGNQTRAQPRVLALILAGGRGSRLSPLTDQRAKPATPFAGHYRLIDFALSNLAHSGLSDVWVVEQYQPHSLNDHLSGGRPWDLDRTRGGLVVMPPFVSENTEDGFAQGNAHALELHAPLIREFAPDLLLVLSADHLYTLNFQEVIDAHLLSQADVTLVTTRVPRQGAERYANVQLQGGRVTQFAYKPDKPLGTGKQVDIAAEMFVYNVPTLLATLKDVREQKGEALGDYGEELLPALVAAGQAYAYPLAGYWRDVGTLEAYLDAHLDLCDGKGVALNAPGWQVLTRLPNLSPACIAKTAQLNQALVCGGAVVAGQVRRSIIGPGAVIEQGASVEDSVVMAGAVVRSGARVRRAVVDEGAVVDTGAKLGSASGVAVVGQRAHLKAGVRLKGGEYLAAGGRKVRRQED